MPESPAWLRARRKHERSDRISNFRSPALDLKIHRLLCTGLSVCATIAFSNCRHAPSQTSRLLTQRAYLWQRDWTPAVIHALSEGSRHLHGVVLLGAEIESSGGNPRIVWANIDWNEVAKVYRDHCSLAVRVAPFPIARGPNESIFQAVAATARSLLGEARVHHVDVDEFQLDYDCAQQSLRAYRDWLRRLREIIGPTRFVITTLPAWLDEPDFAALVREVDSYVLQVHSVPLAQKDATTLCDTDRARRWVARAARLGKPFSVALPTYRCTAGYNRAGRLIGVVMDSVEPSWPPETRALEFSTDANALADLVRDWEQKRPANLCELLWYRLPVATDERNWRWPTLDAVMAGKKPARKFSIVTKGENPIDVSVCNVGQTDDEFTGSLVVTGGDDLLAADALAGWQVETRSSGAVFRVAAGEHLRLAPSDSQKIGWLRYHGNAHPQFALQNEDFPNR